MGVWTVYSQVGKEEFDPEAMSKQEVQSAFEPREFDNPWPADINWTIVYHRIEYGKANGKPCRCESCVEYLAYVEEKYWA